MPRNNAVDTHAHARVHAHVGGMPSARTRATHTCARTLAARSLVAAEKSVADRRRRWAMWPRGRAARAEDTRLGPDVLADGVIHDEPHRGQRARQRPALRRLQSGPRYGASDSAPTCQTSVPPVSLPRSNLKTARSRRPTTRSASRRGPDPASRAALAVPNLRNAVPRDWSRRRIPLSTSGPFSPSISVKKNRSGATRSFAAPLHSRVHAPEIDLARYRVSMCARVHRVRWSFAASRVCIANTRDSRLTLPRKGMYV